MRRKIKFVILLAGGRSGSSLLQSLFDMHPQILQFPGDFRFDHLFVDILNEKDPEKMSQMFCDLNPFFFDSRLQKNSWSIDRHYMLGKNKNEFYNFSTEIFKKHFIYFYNNSKKSKIDKIIALHQAYAKLSGQNLNKKKIIIFHLHIIEWFENFTNYFSQFNNFKILLTFRDPLVSLCSTINHWLEYKSGKNLYSKSLYANYEMHINMMNVLYKFRKKVSIIQLENLHLKSNKVLKNLCKLLKINYQSSLKKSSYHNKLWWGDSVSKKFLNGLNPKFKNKFDKNIFFDKDIEIIESKLKNIITRYNYPTRSKSKIQNKYLQFLPFKFELIVWLNSLKNRRFKQFLLIPFFFIKRLILFSRKNLYSKKELPNSIGS